MLPAPRTYALHEGPALAPSGHQEHVCAVAVTHVAGRVPQVQGGLRDGLLLQEASLDGDGYLLDLAQHPDRAGQIQPLGQPVGGRAGTQHGGGPRFRRRGGLLWARGQRGPGGLGCVARSVTCKAGGDKSEVWIHV